MQTYLEKRQPSYNVARFYRISVMPNLFGEWTLYREWGRIGQGGQVRMDWFDSEDQAVGALIGLETAKRRRGYWVEPQQLSMFTR
jgi:predicted DNA-binding WGR domain protein